MAFYPIRGTVRDDLGRIVVGATVVVKEHNSATAATLSSTEGVATAVALGTLTTDQYGQFSAWVSDDDYPLMQLFDITITYLDITGTATITYPAFSFTSFTGPMLASETGLMDYGTAAPLTGTYAPPFIRWNSAPAGGAAGGWICVAGGTPGTWKEFALINA